MPGPRRALPACTGIGGFPGNSLPFDVGEVGDDGKARVPIDGRGTGFLSLAYQGGDAPLVRLVMLLSRVGLAKRSPRVQSSMASSVPAMSDWPLSPPASSSLAGSLW